MFQSPLDEGSGTYETYDGDDEADYSGYDDGDDEDDFGRVGLEPDEIEQVSVNNCYFGVLCCLGSCTQSYICFVSFLLKEKDLLRLYKKFNFEKVIFVLIVLYER